MAILTVITQVSFRYYMRKSRADLIVRIQEMDGILGDEVRSYSWFEGRDKYELATEMMALHDQLPLE